MSLESLKNQLVSELPLSISTMQRDAQKPTPAPEDALASAEKDESKLEEGKLPNTNNNNVSSLNATESEVLRKNLRSLNAQLGKNALRFEFVEELGVSVIKVIDVTENKTIRQIPSEEMIKRIKEIRTYLEERVYSNVSNPQQVEQLKEAISGILLNRTS